MTDVPAPALPGRTWTITTTEGYAATGYLPAWAEEDPSKTGVAPERLAMELADISHRAPVSGQMMSITCDDTPGTDTVVFWGSIDCNPHSEDSEVRIPVVHLQLVDDYWFDDLGPDQLAEIAAQLREQADRLDREVRPQLIAAREDWAAHHPD